MEKQASYLNHDKTELRKFCVHLIAFCIAIPALVTINVMATPDFYWFLFPLIGWGTAMAFHAFEFVNLVNGNKKSEDHGR